MAILTFIIIFSYMYKEYLTLRIDIQLSLFNSNHFSLPIYNRISYLFSFLHFSLTPCSLFTAHKQLLFCTIAAQKSKLFENIGETIFLTILLPMIVYVKASETQIYQQL